MDDPPGYNSDASTPTAPNAGSALAFSSSVPEPDAPLSPSQTPPASTSTSHQARAAVEKATVANKDRSRLRQPYLESYFAPLAVVAKPSCSTPSSNCYNVEKSQKAVVLRNKRDLEIYVTLPSADRRLFVDVHEDFPSAYLEKEGFETVETSGRSKKRPKLSHRRQGQQETLEEDELCEQSESDQAVTQEDKTGFAGDTTVSSPPPSSVSNGRTNESSGNSTSVQTASTSVKASSKANQTVLSDSSLPSTGNKAKAAPSKQGHEPTFNQVRLNVRIRPPQSTNAGQGSGASVSTVPKPTVPAAKMGSDQERKDSPPLLELNAIRLWHLDEDRLVRLSGGTIASNGITHKSILCYSIGKRTGKTYVNVYGDASLVKEVKLSLELARHWRTENHSAEVEVSKRIEGSHRQRVQYLVRTSATSALPAGSAPVLEESLKRKPFVAAFSADLIADIDTSPSTLDIALSKARAEHEARVADREARQALRQEEREKEAARLESTERKLQKRHSQADLPAAQPQTNSVSSALQSHEAGEGSPLEECLTDSDWSSTGFVDDYLDEHGISEDQCDEGLSFNPIKAKVTMEQAVLLRAQTCDAQSPAPQEVGSDQVDTSLSMPSVREGLTHIFNALNTPLSSQRSIIEDMEKAAKIFPYIAIALADYDDVAISADLEASCILLQDCLEVVRDIPDIHQICILYKGIWKSEVHQWAQICTRLDTVDWPKSALSGSLLQLTAVTAPAAVQSNAIGDSGTTAGGDNVRNVARDPLTRFQTYWTRTMHRRHRVCTACEDEYCSNSRTCDLCNDPGCDGEHCRAGDDFYSNGGSTDNAYAAAASAETSDSRSSDKQETVAALLVPGHRSRIVQCMFLETF